jgi:hypothetical protein
MCISSFPAAFVEEAVFSPLCVLGSFVKDQLAIDAWVYAWIFYSDPLVFMSVLCQCHAVFIAMAVCYSLKLGIVMPPALNFLLRIALAIQGLLFPYVFHDCLFYFCAEFHWNFHRDCNEYVDCFW